MLIHGFVAHSRVNGPGVRAVVYVQGCNLGCSGCWNPATHAFSGPMREVEDVADQIARAYQVQPIDGVTFSGGEPMQQAQDLLALMQMLRRARPEISIGMYSGYAESELDGGRFPFWRDIKKNLDFAVLGRFVAARPSRLPLRTSANQSLRLFSDRYRTEHFTPLEFEVHIESKGLTQITGFPLSGLPA